MKLNPFNFDLEAYRFDWAYSQDIGDWIIEKPQTAFQDALRKGWISGDILDSGCGKGDLGLYLASRNMNVLGIDFSPAAIEEANARSIETNVTADFLVWDIMELDSLDREFDTVVDSGTLHSLESGPRKAYVHQLHNVLRPGGRVVVLAAEEYLGRNELESLFASWRKEFIADSVFETRSGDLNATLACFSR